MKNNTPIFSIIILTMSAEKYLPDLFKSLIGLDLDRCELILINQGKILPSEVVQDFDQFSVVTLIPEHRLPVSSARKFGAEHARGKFIIFLDDDCTVISSSQQFKLLLNELDNNDKDILLLPKGSMVKNEYVIKWPKRRPARLGYFSAFKYSVEWNTIFNRQLFLEMDGFIDIDGIGSDNAAQCGEILIMIYRLLSKKINIRLFEKVKIAHPDSSLARKKSLKIYQYHYGHGFSAGRAICYIPMFLRWIILVGFNLKFLLLFIFPHLQKIMRAVDAEYTRTYIRKNIRYVFYGFWDGFSKNSPRKELP